MWTEPRIDNLLLTIVPHQPRMFRSSAVPWALQLTCGQSIMISLSQLPPAQSLSAVAVTLYARARIVKRAGIVRLCPTLHWRMKPKEWPWYGLWSIFDLNDLQRPEASCFITVYCSSLSYLYWSLKNDLGMAFGAFLVWASCSIWKRLISSLYGVRAHCASLPYFALKPKKCHWYGLWSIFGLNVL